MTYTKHGMTINKKRHSELVSESLHTKKKRTHFMLAFVVLCDVFFILYKGLLLRSYLRHGYIF